MNKLLILTGPTATGKTSLGLNIAKQLPADIISCDSRQIYKYMDVVTGKDIPEGFNLSTEDNKQIYSDGTTSIYGYDIVLPDEEFSSAHYLEFFNQTITHIISQNKLPILVGGTGYYIQTLLNPPETLFIPPRESYRRQLVDKTPLQLYDLLQEADPQKANTLNESDRSNPHRLIRALEVATAEPSSPPSWFQEYQELLSNLDILIIALTAPLSYLYKRIDQRVEERIGHLLDKEIEYLKNNNYLYKAPLQTLGYQQLIKFLEGEITQQQAITMWKNAEHAYARRQITWLKKQPDIIRYDISEASIKKQVVNQVTQWYTQTENPNMIT